MTSQRLVVGRLVASSATKSFILSSANVRVQDVSKIFDYRKFNSPKAPQVAGHLAPGASRTFFRGLSSVACVPSARWRAIKRPGNETPQLVQVQSPMTAPIVPHVAFCAKVVRVRAELAAFYTNAPAVVVVGNCDRRNEMSLMVVAHSHRCHVGLCATDRRYPRRAGERACNAWRTGLLSGPCPPHPSIVHMVMRGLSEVSPLCFRARM
jgi:hypothetical protein